MLYLFCSIFIGELMASGHDLEKEAAKLTERLIQESKDDPPKLATKLCLVHGTQFCFVYQNLKT